MDSHLLIGAGGDGLWYEFINAQLMALENRVLV